MLANQHPSDMCPLTVNKLQSVTTHFRFSLVFQQVLVVQVDQVHSLPLHHLHLVNHVVPEDQEFQADHHHHVHLLVLANQALPRIEYTKQI